MFSRIEERDGKTIETAGWLGHFSLPGFMKVGEAYQVSVGPSIFKDRIFLFLFKIHRYRIKRCNLSQQTFFVESMTVLPEQFFVMESSFGFTWYQYLPIEPEGREAKMRRLILGRMGLYPGLKLRW